MSQDRQGYRIEEMMMKFFRGIPSHYDEVDFQTKTTLYEVKSCRLFNKCYNGNDKRPFTRVPNKKIETMQHGRFQFITNNHVLLYLRALQLNKKARYILVVTVQKQFFYKILDWTQITTDNKRNKFSKSIKEVFY